MSIAPSGKSMRQGYITLATGSTLYLEIAINLALSLRLNDPTRPICLVLDQGKSLPEIYKPFIDFVAYLEPKDGFHGCLNKLRLHEISPFEESMFIDADCILVKNDMDRHWERFSSEGFTIAGDTVTTGDWYGFSIQDVIRDLGINYMARMNSGVFYFKKGAQTNLFFETTLNLVKTKNKTLGSYHRNKFQLADEPFIGATIGMLKMQPISYTPEEGSIMVTTINSSKVVLDPIKKISSLIIESDFKILGRLFPKTKTKHSPSLAHFVKLKPRNEYISIANNLRITNKISRFEI